MIYHVGLLKQWGTKRQTETLVIEACRDIDYLSCELWRYEGRRETTKKELRAKRFEIMAWANTLRPADWPEFKHVQVW